MYGILRGDDVLARFVAPMTVRSNTPVYLSDSMSLSRYAARRPPQRWEMETNVEPLYREANDLFAFLVEKGVTSSFQIMVPQNYGVLMARTAEDTLTAVLGYAGDSSLKISEVTGLIPMGTFLRFANHTKVYMLTHDVEAAQGEQVIEVFPPLMTDVINQAIVYRDDVRMEVFLDGDSVIGMSYVDGILMDNGAIRMVERVPKIVYELP